MQHLAQLYWIINYNQSLHFDIYYVFTLYSNIKYKIFWKMHKKRCKLIKNQLKSIK